MLLVIGRAERELPGSHVWFLRDVRGGFQCSFWKRAGNGAATRFGSQMVKDDGGAWVPE